MFGISMRRSRAGISLSAILAFALGACATRSAPRSYPVRPFYDDLLAHVRVGMPADSLVLLFGPPDTTFEMTFGSKTDRQWQGVVYRYYVAKDPMYQYVDEWKKNTFYFYRSPQGLLLNHWVIEHRMARPEPVR